MKEGRVRSGALLDEARWEICLATTATSSLSLQGIDEETAGEGNFSTKPSLCKYRDRILWAEEASGPNEVSMVLSLVTEELAVVAVAVAADAWLERLDFRSMVIS